MNKQIKRRKKVAPKKVGSAESTLYLPKKKFDRPKPRVYWVPGSKDGPGHFVRPHVGKMKADTLDRLTRGKVQAAKKPSGPTASGRYLLPGGGRFSNADPKGEFDWIVHRAKSTPGPNQYKVKVNSWGTGGIKISDANPKSEIEWTIYRAKQLPAPNAYGLIKMPGPSGGKFSTAFPLSELDRTILRSNDIPGPNNYKIDLCPTYPKTSTKWVQQKLSEMGYYK